MINSPVSKKDNIAEYLLYMWQVEDIIRAYDLDIDKIKENIIKRYPSISESQQDEYIEWYDNLIEMMRHEGVKESGHLQINKNIMLALVDFHQELLKSPKYPDYSAEFYRTLPFIVELRSKSGNHLSGEVETCFNALYGMLLLRIQGKEISPDTAIAMKQISHFIALLAHYYKKNEESPLFESDLDK